MKIVYKLATARALILRCSSKFIDVSKEGMLLFLFEEVESMAKQLSKEEMRELMHLAANHADALMRSAIDSMMILLGVTAITITVISERTIKGDIVAVALLGGVVVIFLNVMTNRHKKIEATRQKYHAIYQEYFDNLYPNTDGNNENLKKLRELEFP